MLEKLRLYVQKPRAEPPKFLASVSFTTILRHARKCFLHGRILQKFDCVDRGKRRKEALVAPCGRKS